MNNQELIEFTTTVFHRNSSSAAAFNVLFEEKIPPGLQLWQPVNISSSPNFTPRVVESEVVERENGTSLRIFSSVFTIDSEIVLTYITQLDKFVPKEQNLTTSATVEYFSIKQEGIGERVSVSLYCLYILNVLSVFICVYLVFFPERQTVYNFKFKLHNTGGSSFLCEC